MEQIGIIKKDGKLRTVSLDALVWASVCDKEFFDEYFELTPTGKTCNIKECDVFGFIDLDKDVLLDKS